ncbi:UDP-glucuronosyltransferase [Cecembia calidifontis]|jgi:hypothetical protein|uniref:UDP-glucuronosyltransferase n=1 Tax=Cecembia calidifontis TaxID=1187080 RepID=A0A4Q7P6Z9_9BACT|nr:UDP-glucuronosyltransferase [Cecembia calidifontis]RZS95804.1 hypothetical protein BC751_1348 [Cecembia calidifontis]
MIDFNFRPETYFDGTGPTALLAKLTYPESRWGEEINVYCNVIDGEYHFEAIDFYGNDLMLRHEKSQKPLSLQEMIVLIETMEAKASSSQGNVELTLCGIPEVQSHHYPDLEKYFTEKRKNFGLN